LRRVARPVNCPHSKQWQRPFSSDISLTDNVYNAFFAMLTAIANYNKHNKVRIHKVLCPGMGTATGKMTAIEASRQMYTAYKNFHKPTSNMNWKNLTARHSEIIGQLTNH